MTDSGVAHIKEEYLIDVPVYVKETDSTAEDVKEPPQKKVKSSGARNKNRPWVNIVPRNKKLCPQLWSIPKGQNDYKSCCTFPNCGFSHNVEEYLSTKPPNLGTACHSYRTYGKCRYGLICRFSSEHLDGIYNCVQKDQWKKYEDNPPVINNLNRELQQILRKKKYDLKDAIKITNEVRAQVNLRKKLLREKKNTNVDALEDVKKDIAVTKDIPNTLPEKEISLPVDENKKNDCSSNGKATPNDSIHKDETNSLAVQKDLHSVEKCIGPASDQDLIKPRLCERKKLEWHDKLYLAPLTTLGNLPFRRVCKQLGADITCSEMAVAGQLLQGTTQEWALIKRHESEDFYGVQLCASNVETMVKCSQLLTEKTDNIDFIDINMGCPIDLIYKQGAGSALMRRQFDVEAMVLSMKRVTSCPITLKMRTAIYQDTKVAHTFVENAKLWDVDLVTVHGRSREQRYLKSADWNYIDYCAKIADPLPLFGNGDVFTYEDYNLHKKNSNVAGMMIGRGALIKPWIFTELKEQRHWDITAMERLDILKKFVNCGMEHWGSDNEGIEKTRRFLLEWLSFLYRYIPVGILEAPQSINQRPLAYKGRNELETLMASKNCCDWIKISEMILGKVPDDFQFLPKHKANSWG